MRLRNRQMAEAWNAWDFLHLVEEMEFMPADSVGKALSGRLHAYSKSPDRR